MTFTKENTQKNMEISTRRKKNMERRKSTPKATEKINGQDLMERRKSTPKILATVKNTKINNTVMELISF